MPLKAWPLWLLSVVTVVGLPAVSWLYYPLLLDSGALPTDADSIGIPMLGSLIIAMILFPIAIGATWFCLRRYNSKSRFAAWRRDRPVRTLLTTALLGLPAAILAAVILGDLREEVPWYEHLWDGYALVCIVWLLALRAAFVEQLDH